MPAPCRHPMARIASILSLNMIACLTLVSTALHAGTPDPPIITNESVIRFATHCAHCHEGQCSGRLSFEDPQQVARDHVQRYAGPLAPEATQALIQILEYMKKRCAYYPLPELAPSSNGWSMQQLAPYATPDRTGWFIPLGLLEPGKHCLLIELATPARLHIDLVSTNFDLIYEQVDAQFARENRIEIELDEAQGVFLRLTAKEGFILRHLRLGCQ